MKVTGTATVEWTLEIPDEYAGQDGIVEETVSEAIRHQNMSIYMRGEENNPVKVWTDLESDSVVFEDDERE